MNKNTMFLAAMGAGVLGVWLYMRKQAVNPATGLSYPANYNPAQPSQQYPWQANTPPRVDNANQPWYNNSKQAMSGPAETGFLTDFAMNLKAGSSVVHSLQDVWGNLSNIFSSPDPQRDLMDADSLISFNDSEMSGFDWESPDFSDWENSGGEYSAYV